MDVAPLITTTTSVSLKHKYDTDEMLEEKFKARLNTLDHGHIYDNVEH